MTNIDNIFDNDAEAMSEFERFLDAVDAADRNSAGEIITPEMRMSGYSEDRDPLFMNFG